MPYHFFAIRAVNPAADQAELNQFLGAHRVVGVRWRWISLGMDSHWVARVEFAGGTGGLPDVLKAAPRAAGTAAASGGAGGVAAAEARIDDRFVLTPADFARFAALRVWRKAIASRDGLPLYAVFTDKQLAAIVTGNVRSLPRTARPLGVPVGAADAARQLPEGPIFSAQDAARCSGVPQ